MMCIFLRNGKEGTVAANALLSENATSEMEVNLTWATENPIIEWSSNILAQLAPLRLVSEESASK